MSTSPDHITISWTRKTRRSIKPPPPPPQPPTPPPLPEFNEGEVIAAEALILLANCNGGFCPSTNEDIKKSSDTSVNNLTISDIKKPNNESSNDAVPSTKKRKRTSPDSNSVYMCEQCGKTFSSGAALGGHMTSHRQKLPTTTASASSATRKRTVALNPSGKPHVCCFCNEDFPTGQALGGHMRKHNEVAVSINAAADRENTPSCDDGASSKVTVETKGLNIDLNLPPPLEN